MDPLELLTRLPVPWLARCRVPRHLEAVRSAGPEAKSRDLGISQGRIDGIWEAAEGLYRTGVHPGIQLCIRYRGEVVLDRAIGHACGNGPSDPVDAPRQLMTPETPSCIYSASKAITAMVIHKLDEKRMLHLEDPVCEYIPEFASHGKRRITLRHVLAHRAGIPNLPPEAMDLDLLGRPDRVVEILSDARPRTRPGRLLAYHAVSGGFVLGEVVRRVTGQDIRTVLGKEILEPMGLRWTNYGVKPQDVPEVAVCSLTGPPVPPPVNRILRNALGTSLAHAIDISNDPRFLTGIVPAANIVTTANELSAFYQCLLDDGQLGGVRIFEPRTVRHATAEQSYWEFDLTLGAPLRYGLGFMLGGPVSAFGWDNPDAFGHLGLSNVISWADPGRHIAVALLNTGKPAMSVHMVRLVQLLVAIARAFPNMDER